MQPMSANGQPLPRRTPTSAVYFDNAKEHRLVLQRCATDGFFFYPRSVCPTCLGRDWEWEEVSGRGVVYAFTIDRIGHDPAQRGRLPLVVAAIDLEEGVRLTSNVIGCDPETVEVGMEVEVVFEDLEPETLILFRPR